MFEAGSARSNILCFRMLDISLSDFTCVYLVKLDLE